jgi:hypothetical protein
MLTLASLGLHAQLWVFLDVLFDSSKSASSLYNPRGMTTHLLPVVMVLLETKLELFGEKEAATPGTRTRFRQVMCVYIFSYIAWSLIYYQLAGLTRTSMTGDVSE